MSSERKCSECGRPLAAEALEELCPACLIEGGFGTGLAPEPGQPGRTHRFVPPAMAELAGLFPQLEIQQLLGQGGMGAVYRARQPALDRLVALKILPPQTSGDAGFAERFTREARALARLNHPNIVGVYDFGVADGLHYFVMEHVEGLNLRQVQQAGRLSPREALKVIPQICDALQFAHDEGVVHRDIKPENVMLDKKGRVKITDFGLAKILGRDTKGLRLTGVQEVMGTPHYMAPEQIEHPQTVDHRADIYSLGVVFYEMLTGELPLGKFQPPSRKVQVDVRLDEVVLHALEKEPERRYQQASQVKNDVETIVSRPAPGPSGQTPEAPEARPRERLQLRSRSVLAVLLVSVVAVTMLLNFVTRPRQKSLGTEVQTPDWQWPDTPAIADSKTPMIQDKRIELSLDGVACFRLHAQKWNDTGAALQTIEFINSDFVNVTNITDAHHHPIAFTKTHEMGMGGIFRYSLTLNEPVPPGQPVSHIVEGTETGLVTPTGAPGVFEYSVRHRPVAGQHTRRIERHRLPPGASLLEKQPNDLRERVRDGRIELFIDRLIPPGDSLEIEYRFRLDQGDKSAIRLRSEATADRPPEAAHSFVQAALAGANQSAAPRKSDASGALRRIHVDPRVELLSLIFRLAGNPEYNQARVASYAADAERQFGRFRGHPVVALAAKLRNTQGVSYDACMGMAVHLTDPDDMRFRTPLVPWPESLDRRWTVKSASDFLAAARRFVKDTGFDDFTAKHRALYQTTESRLKALLDQHAHLEWFIDFFGEKPNAAFTVIPGMLNGGCNYGAHFRAAGGPEELFCMLGVWRTDSDGLPEFTPGMVGTVVHEFGHAYANPLIDRHWDDLRAPAQILYNPVAQKMRSQAYGQPATMLRESLVRACGVRYVRRHEGDEAASEAIRREKRRGFLWIQELSDLLGDYEAHRDQYPTLEAFAPRLVAFFQDCATQAQRSGR
ncbi:MAG: DUF4932 domain-containing protein [Verrucomicrobia bacterium]|nr:DUF4932 domain-containing protein [Verrucomicrobiota bacterium]